jgi:putative pyruvate formate lyase activating enzyme
MSLMKRGELQERIEKAQRMLRNCELCPRKCRVNRLSGETGFCKTGVRARVASFHAHFGEEPPLVGKHGSGTIFFSFCNLLCSFCQNFELSHRSNGEEVYPDELAGIMIRLQDQGCHNINFVTPTHVVPQILSAIMPAIDAGLNIPLVYNCGGYESVRTLHMLEGITDIYMPDFKFWDDRWAWHCCGVTDYQTTARSALMEMHRQVGDLEVDESGVAVRGLLVRHLVMPNGLAGTEGVVRFISEDISANTYVNIMDQYRPCGYAVQDAMINRRITAREWKDALTCASRAGLKRVEALL